MRAQIATFFRSSENHADPLDRGLIAPHSDGWIVTEQQAIMGHDISKKINDLNWRYLSTELGRAKRAVRESDRNFARLIAAA